MATGKVWCGRGGSTSFTLEAYDFGGNLLSSETISGVPPYDARCIIAREDKVVFVVSDYIYTKHSGGVSSFQWYTGSEFDSYWRGFTLSYANGTFYFAGKTSIYGRVSFYSYDGITWVTIGASLVSNLACYNSADGRTYSSSCHTNNEWPILEGALFVSSAGQPLENGVTFINYADALNKIVYEGILYYFGKAYYTSDIYGFQTYVPGVGLTLVTSVPWDTQGFIPYFYVAPSGRLRCDLFISAAWWELHNVNVCDTYELNLSKTAFTLVNSITLPTGEYFSTRLMTSYNDITTRDPTEAYTTTGGYVSINFRQAIGENIRIDTPNSSAEVPIPNTSVLAIESGSYDAFNDFWVEEDDCSESAYVY